MGMMTYTVFQLFSKLQYVIEIPNLRLSPVKYSHGKSQGLRVEYMC